MNRHRSQNLFTDLYPQSALNVHQDSQIRQIKQFYSYLFGKPYSGSSLQDAVHIENPHHNHPYLTKTSKHNYAAMSSKNTQGKLTVGSVIDTEADINRCQYEIKREKNLNKQRKFDRIKNLLSEQQIQNQIKRHKSFHGLGITGHPEQSTRESVSKDEKPYLSEYEAGSVKSKIQDLENNLLLLKDQNKHYGKKMRKYESNLLKLQLQIQELKQNQRILSESKDFLAQSSKFDQSFVQEMRLALNQQSENKINIALERDQLLSQLNQTLHNHEQELSQLKQRLAAAEEQALRLKQREQKHDQQVQQLRKQVEELNKERQELQQRNEILEEDLFEQKHSCQALQSQVQRLQEENSLLNEESTQLAQSLHSMRQQCGHTKDMNSEFEQLMKRKQKEINQLRQKYETAILRLDQIQDESQFLRKVAINSDATIRQQSKTIEINNQHIDKLSKEIELSCGRSDAFLASELKKLLKLPQNSPNQQILVCLRNVIEHQQRLQHYLQGYFQIAQLFGVQPRTPSCHEKLISQVCRYKNNMGVLVRKLTFSEGRLAALSQENQHLSACLENNQQAYVSYSGSLENLIHSQNQELMESRAAELNEKVKRKYHYF